MILSPQSQKLTFRQSPESAKNEGFEPDGAEYEPFGDKPTTLCRSRWFSALSPKNSPFQKSQLIPVSLGSGNGKCYLILKTYFAGRPKTSLLKTLPKPSESGQKAVKWSNDHCVLELARSRKPNPTTTAPRDGQNQAKRDPF